MSIKVLKLEDHRNKLMYQPDEDFKIIGMQSTTDWIVGDYISKKEVDSIIARTVPHTLVTVKIYKPT